MADDTKDFTEKQKQHAQDIRTTRQVQKKLGLSFAEARKRLENFDRQVRNDQNRPAVRLAEEDPGKNRSGGVVDGPSNHIRKSGFIEPQKPGAGNKAGGGNSMTLNVAQGGELVPVQFKIV